MNEKDTLGSCITMLRDGFRVALTGNYPLRSRTADGSNVCFVYVEDCGGIRGVSIADQFIAVAACCPVHCEDTHHPIPIDDFFNKMMSDTMLTDLVDVPLSSSHTKYAYLQSETGVHVVLGVGHSPSAIDVLNVQWKVEDALNCTNSAQRLSGDKANEAHALMNENYPDSQWGINRKYNPGDGDVSNLTVEDFLNGGVA